MSGCSQPPPRSGLGTPPHGSNKLCPWLVGTWKRGCLFLLPGGSPSAQGRGGRLPPTPPGGFLLFVMSFLSLVLGSPRRGDAPGSACRNAPICTKPNCTKRGLFVFLYFFFFFPSCGFYFLNKIYENSYFYLLPPTARERAGRGVPPALGGLQGV